VTQTGLDNQMGSEVTTLYNALEAVHKRKLWLDDAAHPDAFFTALGYTNQTDINNMRATFSDLGSNVNGLYAVAHGIFHTAANNDFFANAKLATGMYYGGSAT
jgi:hypothetical protein